MLYPTPRFPNLPNADRSRLIWVALMFVYSAISCEEIRCLPIFRACVSTWRYRDRRAATPTVSRSDTPASSRDLVTAQPSLPGGAESRPAKLQARLRSPSLCELPAEGRGVDEVDDS